MFQVRSIPTVLIFKQNIGVFRESRGFRPKELEVMIEKTRALNMDEIRERIAEAQEEAEREALEENQEESSGSVLD